MLTSASTERAFDVVVVGAGPAGAATALKLVRGGARVALVERRAAPEDRMGESLRGIGTEALRELGVWQEFCRLEHRRSHLHRSVWAGVIDERPAIRLRFGPDLHVDRRAFAALLIDAAVAQRVELFRPAYVRAISEERGAVQLSLASEGGTLRLRAARVIDATGRSAALARGFGAERYRTDRLIGIARSFDRDARHPFTTVESADHGWWYTAPRPAGRMVALFVTDADSPAREARQSRVWIDHSASAPHTRRLLLGAELSAPRSYSAAPGVLDWNPDGPVLPVGDAALSFDPIAADGLCFALRSGIEAAAVVLGAGGSARAYRAGIHEIYRRHLGRREAIYASERAHRPTDFWSRSRSGEACPPTMPRSPRGA